jgi:hypothetical protein
MARLPDLSELNPAQLRALIEEAKAQIEKVEQKSIDDLKAKFAKMAEQAGVSMDRVMGKASTGRVKYRNEEGKEWLSGGKGNQKPDWLIGNEKKYRVAA